ncbi:MAG: NAD(P)H-hydrate dehydratase [Candidatus Micrarchaeaceae archaeon]
MVSEKSSNDSISVIEAYATMLNAKALGIKRSCIEESAAAQIATKINFKNIVVACGTGGKGRIGYAVARNLLGSNHTCKVYIAAFMTKRVKAIEKPKWIDSAQFIDTERDFEKFVEVIKNADCAVDALIGIGLKWEPNGILGKGIDEINKCKNIISIDIPAGIYADTGKMCKKHINATRVFAIYKKKKAMVYNKFPYAEIINAGIPKSAELYTGPGDLLLAGKALSKDANKYSHGCVLVIGGSETYHGAPIAAANASNALLASLRTGAGYASMLLPRELGSIAKKLSTNSIVYTFDNYTDLLEKIKNIKHNSVIIGMGMQNISEKILNEIIEKEVKLKNAVIVDGGAIDAAKKIFNLNGSIITPHDGEFYRLTGRKPSEDIEKRVRDAIDFSKRHKGILVLKGHQTIIAGNGKVKISNPSSSALATMGTGDVLAGIIGAYSAICKDGFKSAVAGVYTHASIGDILYKQKGNHILASDIINEIPNFLKKFDNLYINFQ